MLGVHLKLPLQPASAEVGQCGRACSREEIFLLCCWGGIANTEHCPPKQKAWVSKQATRELSEFAVWFVAYGKLDGQGEGACWLMERGFKTPEGGGGNLVGSTREGGDWMVTVALVELSFTL